MNQQLVMEIEQCKMRISHQSDELSHLKKAFSRAQLDLDRVRQTNAEIEARTLNAQQKYEVLHEFAQSVVEKIYVLMDRKSDMEHEIAALKNERCPSSPKLALEMKKIECQKQMDQAALDEANQEIELQVSAMRQLFSQQNLFESKLTEQRILIDDFEKEIEFQTSQLIPISADEVECCQKEVFQLNVKIRKLKQQRSRQQQSLAKMKQNKGIIRGRILINQQLKERIKTVQQEIKSDESKLSTITSENETARETEIAHLAELLRSLTATSHDKKKEVRQIRDQVLALKSQAKQLEEDLRLAESVIRKQQQQRSNLLSRLTPYDLNHPFVHSTQP